MSCKCQQCQQLYKVDFTILDELWNEISGSHNLLCGSCICLNIEKLNKYAHYNINGCELTETIKANKQEYNED